MSNNLSSKRCYLDRESISVLPEEAGVYFLYQDGNVLVYIGKATNIHRRVPNHDKEKVFCRVGYELTHFSRARTLEKQLIALYVKEHGQLPYYNRQR
ncbi:MAG: hypothetical protein PHN78_07570 [Dehalococcoidales bacterium]|nr:hypothetical protein [Dehalococcoidales bacterium]